MPYPHKRARARRRSAAGALVAGLAIIGAAPLPGVAGLLPASGDADKLTSTLQTTVRSTVAGVGEQVRRVVHDVQPTTPAPREAQPRQAATPQNPQTQPPLHGTNPHGQGDVAVVDFTPSDKRPQGGDPTGKDSGEEIVVGRARGEQRADGTYHGHITIAALFGNEIVGVDTVPGEKKAGPLDPLQTQLLDAICNGSGNQVCVSLVRADSSTTGNGSTNKFSTAHATVGGGQTGLDVGAAESNGNIASDGQCQTSHGDTTVAQVNGGGGVIAQVAKSATDSKACKGAAPTQANSSSVIGLGGTAVPLPAAGCGDGTADTQTGIPTLLPIVCNADDSNAQAAAPNGVRQALSIFALATGTTSAAKVGAAGSESAAVAPATQCADGKDNDGDGLIDAADGGCHSDGNASNSSSYVASDDDESGGNTGGNGNGSGGNGNGNGSGESSGNGAQCADGKDNDGDGKIDARDPGCHTDGNADNASSYDANDDSEGGGANGSGNRTQCANGVDDDGDGKVDAADPGCHTDGNANNPASYDANDDSEGSDNGANAAASSLPFTGADVVGMLSLGLLLLAGGVTMRRRAGGLA